MVLVVGWLEDKWLRGLCLHDGTGHLEKDSLVLPTYEDATRGSSLPLHEPGKGCLLDGFTLNFYFPAILTVGSKSLLRTSQQSKIPG